MIRALESMVRQCPLRTCLTYVDETGIEYAYSYREVRMLSASIARNLRDGGVKSKDSVVVDLPNCPAFVFLVLAAAYGDFSLIILNNRLTITEKLSRVMEVERRPEVHVAMRIDEAGVRRLMDTALFTLAGEDQPSPRDGLRVARTSFSVRHVLADAEVRSTRALGRAASGRASLRRREEMARQDALEGVIHFAEHAARVFDRDTRAVIMFTSGTTGRAKAVDLSWNNICHAAEISNKALNYPGEGLWQAVLPLYHIGGLEVVLRSLLNANPFSLYRRFDADRILCDANRKGATHISVVDKMLQDLLASSCSDALRHYNCILLGGGPSHEALFTQIKNLGARVYASYGMTETSSQIAHSLVDGSFRGGLRLLPGYQAHIVDPGDDGFGRLAVKGPGLFRGYINAQAAYTVDNFFLTGDTAALCGGLLYIKERSDDMFVSGGENIYPAEIRQKLLAVRGVSDAYVFGVPDALWGRRPVAFVERDKTTEASSLSSLSASVLKSVEPHLSKLYQPKHLCALDEFPRNGIGKTDRKALELQYQKRIEVAQIKLHHIRLPFVKPFKTPKGTLTQRDSLIVEVIDTEGRCGLGECVSFASDWYAAETLAQDKKILAELLAPMLLGRAFLHPQEVSEVLSGHSEALRYPFARGALEPALWDLYGHIVKQPLWHLIGGVEPACKEQGLTKDPLQKGLVFQQQRVAAGATIGLGSVQEVLTEARKCQEAGYQRIKLKVVPGYALDCVRTVREALPDIMITLDANQSFMDHDIDELRQIGAFNVAWIEEPLGSSRFARTDSPDLFTRLAALQRTITTPVCLDESLSSSHCLKAALRHPELRYYTVKIGRFGGVKPALDFIQAAHGCGITVWMGGMYDTGISRRLHAAFGTLGFVRAPGDVGSTGRYLAHDITTPPYTAERGMIALNRHPHPYGLGCELNRSILSRVLVDRVVIGQDH